MLKPLIAFLFLLLCQLSYAADTTWLNRQWIKTDKENAVYYSLVGKEANGWHRQIFYVMNGQLYMNGFYTDATCNTKTGNFKYYTPTGLLTDSVVYQNNIALYNCIFHDNGQKKTVLIHNEKNTATYVNSWDRFGNESYLDTFYHDNKGQDCHKDTAFLKGIINKEDSIWRLRFYYIDNDRLYITAYFKERLCKTRVKYSVWRHEEMQRDSVLFNDNGKKKEAWYFYNNGNKNAWQTYDSSGKIVLARNWDENGNETKTDTSSIHALPVEGYKAWEKRLMKQMNNDNSLDWKYRRDLYSSVYISFFVNEDGTLKSAAIQEASLYPAMDTLILNACKETLLWKPCTIHGRSRPCTRVKCFSYVAGVVLKAKDMYY